MKKLFFAAVAILILSLSSCRNNDIENVNEEVTFEKLKINEESKTESRDSIPTGPSNPSDDTGIGPIVVTPPR